MFQYIKDTRGELRHVAWPTQTQTVIYTTLVIGISLLSAAYLGLFDYVFTSGLEIILDVTPTEAPLPISEQPSSEVLPTAEVTLTPAGEGALEIVPQNEQ